LILDNEIVQGVVRIVVAVAVLIFIISIYNEPPPFMDEQPVLELSAPKETLEVIEWYPTMTPDITFDEGNGGNRPWGN